MRRALLVLVSYTAALQAQAVSLEGPWKLRLDDNPGWAQPGTDDSAWAIVKAPFRTTPEADIFWLRRTVAAPGCREDCYITLGLISEAYRLYVNGVLIGEAGGSDDSELHFKKPHAFRIPEEIARAATLAIAVRARNPHIMWGKTGQGVRDEGPYWITNREHALASVEASRNRIRLLISPSLASLCVQAGIGLCLMILWFGDRRRLELLFFAGNLLALSVLECIGISVLYAGGSSWSIFFLYRPWNLMALLFLIGALRIVLGVPAWPAWVMGITALVSLALDLTYSHTLLYLVPLLALLSWLCVSAIREAPRANAFIVLPCLLFIGIDANNVIPARIRPLPLALSVGGLSISYTSLAQGLLGAFMLILVLRRLSADRQEKLRMLAEFEAGRGIQQLLLAGNTQPSEDYRVDAVYLPAQELGGDLYYALPGDNGGFILIAGDVSGKGLKAALQVSLLIGALRETRERRSPALLLQTLNRAVFGQTGGGFVTCCCAAFLPDGSVTIASAGHPAPLVAGREIAVSPGLPLGVTEDVAYTETTLVLAAGQSVTFLSDGVIEAANSKGELFGFERTRSLSGNPAAEIAEAARIWGQNDDITVVTVRRSEPRRAQIGSAA